VNEKDPIPRGGRESLQEKASPLAGRQKRTIEGSGPVSKVKDVMHVASESCGEIPCLPPPGTCMENTRRKSTVTDLQKASFRGKRGNDGQNRLVESHQCSTPDGVKDSLMHSHIGLRHRPKSCDICHACNLATVVSPCV
jgi:hypothetical protein